MSPFAPTERYRLQGPFTKYGSTTAKASDKLQHVNSQLVWPHGWPPGYSHSIPLSTGSNRAELRCRSRESRVQGDNTSPVNSQIVWPHGWPPGHPCHSTLLPTTARNDDFGRYKPLGPSGGGSHHFQNYAPAGQRFQCGGQNRETSIQEFNIQRSANSVLPASLRGSDFLQITLHPSTQAQSNIEGFTRNHVNTKWYATHGLQHASVASAPTPISPIKRGCGGVTSKRKLVDTDFTDSPVSAPGSSDPPVPRKREHLRKRDAAPIQQEVRVDDIETHFSPQIVQMIRGNDSGKHDVPPLPRPVPAEVYLKLASEHPTRLAEPRSLTHKPLLVIVDLNGTLLVRKRGPPNFKRRPGLRRFLSYLLVNHKVMIWSSARLSNVSPIVRALAAEGLEASKLIAVWGRETLGLSDAQYNNKIQVYKQLQWVWTDEGIQPQGPAAEWDQTNTVLIDDTIEKAAGQPHNLVEVPEFDGNPTHEPQHGVLKQVEEYLEVLRWQSNVSAYMRKNQFLCRTSQDHPPVVTGE